MPLFPILNRVKVKRAQQTRDDKFLFQNVKNNEIFEDFKMFKNNRWINAYYTKSKRLQFIGLVVLFSTGNSLFWVNLVQKIKIVSLSWNLVPKLIEICRIQRWWSHFLFLTINILLGQIWSKNSKLFFGSEICYKD